MCAATSTNHSDLLYSVNRLCTRMNKTDQLLFEMSKHWHSNSVHSIQLEICIKQFPGKNLGWERIHARDWQVIWVRVKPQLMDITDRDQSWTIHIWETFSLTFSNCYPGQRCGGSQAFPGNIGSKLGIHPRWDASPLYGTMHIAICTHRLLPVVSSHTGMFLGDGKKLENMHGHSSSGSNQGSWSQEFYPCSMPPFV